MVSKREPHQKPWMPADEYGRSLGGFSFNLLVRNMAKAIAFRARGPRRDRSLQRQ